MSSSAMTGVAIVGNRIGRTDLGGTAGSSGSSKPATPSPDVSRNSERPSAAADILREVSPDKGFFFYIDEHVPAGVSAYSLGQFLEKLKSVELMSIQFHLPRCD